MIKCTFPLIYEVVIDRSQIDYDQAELITFNINVKIWQYSVKQGIDLVNKTTWLGPS